jgi:PKD repeat protein
MTDFRKKHLGDARLWVLVIALLLPAIVFHSCGKEESITQSNNCAVADFVGTPAAGDRPHTVTFTNLSQPDGADFEWNFGDGETSTERNPTHEYDSCGTFDVTLQVSADCGSRSATKTDLITVNAPKRIISVTPNATGYLYPTHINGDREFMGHGPDVTLRATLQTSADGTKLEVVIYMYARETTPDWSTAEGTWTFTAYTAPTGWKVSDIPVASNPCVVTYTDAGSDIKFNGCDWVTFRSVGDTSGNDIGGTGGDNDTNVSVTFSPFSIEIEENC